jgi:hypothetical protein
VTKRVVVVGSIKKGQTSMVVASDKEAAKKEVKK